MNDVAGNIRKLREKKGLTQDALAGKLYVTRQAVSNWETGKNEPDLRTLEALSKVFGVTMEELISGKRIPCTEEQSDFHQFEMNAGTLVPVLGAAAVLTLMDLFFMEPWLMEQKGRSFKPWPEVLNRICILPIGFFCIGMFVSAFVLLQLKKLPEKKTRIALKIAAFMLLFPSILTILVTALMFFGGRVGNIWNLISSVFLSNNLRLSLFLYILPVIAGFCMYPGFVRQKK